MRSRKRLAAAAEERGPVRMVRAPAPQSQAHVGSCDPRLHRDIQRVRGLRNRVPLDLESVLAPDPDALEERLDL